MHSLDCPSNVNLEGYRPGGHMDSTTGQCPREERVGGVGPLLASTAPPSSCGSDGTSLSRYWLPSLDPPLVGAGQTSLERSNPLAGRTPFPFQILGGYLGRYLKGLFF